MPKRQLFRADCSAVTCALLIAAAVVLGLAAPARAVFTGGPSVRVTPNDKVEIRWIADFIGDGTVNLFDNPNGSGTPVITNVSVAPANDHTITFNVGGVLTADTTSYFKVTHHDPNNNRPDLTNEPPPFPPVFTGVQAISGLSVVPGANSALVSWDANVIGLGRVDYGLTSPDGNVASDAFNTTDHSIGLTGLSPNTTYQFLASNLHAIDGGTLASLSGSFTTVPEPSAGTGVAAAVMLLARRRRRSGSAAA